MAYLGRQPVIGNFQKCDSIAVVNGQAAYTLQVGGTNVSPQSENHMLVSLNGILQAPVDSFTVSGSTLTFASNLITGDVIDFVMILGNVLDLGVPSDNTVTTAKISDSAITPAKLGYNYNQYRNIIINGDMSIAQRGTSTSSVSTTQYPSLDRWQLFTQTAGSAVFTVSQDTDVPSGQGFAKSHKIDVTTALGTYGASNFTSLRQRIEGQMLGYLKKGTANAESLTLSFWVKSNKTGTYIAELFDADNSRQISKAYTIDDASTWEKKTITFEGDTTGALDNDNATSLDLRFWLGAGSNYTSGTLNTSWNSSTDANKTVGQVNLADDTANNFWITGVQLEAGTTASDFEFLPVDVNLERCQRYYQKLSISLINLNTTGLTGFVFPVEMRANPSVSRSYLGNANRMYNVGTGATADVVSPVTLVSTKTVRYWYAFSPAAWATATRSSWETDYTMDSEL